MSSAYYCHKLASLCLFSKAINECPAQSVCLNTTKINTLTLLKVCLHQCLRTHKPAVSRACRTQTAAAPCGQAQSIHPQVCNFGVNGISFLIGVLSSNNFHTESHQPNDLLPSEPTRFPPERLRESRIQKSLHHRNNLP